MRPRTFCASLQFPLLCFSLLCMPRGVSSISRGITRNAHASGLFFNVRSVFRVDSLSHSGSGHTAQQGTGKSLLISCHCGTHKRLGVARCYFGGRRITTTSTATFAVMDTSSGSSATSTSSLVLPPLPPSLLHYPPEAFPSPEMFSSLPTSHVSVTFPKGITSSVVKLGKKKKLGLDVKGISPVVGEKGGDTRTFITRFRVAGDEGGGEAEIGSSSSSDEGGREVGSLLASLLKENPSVNPEDIKLTSTDVSIPYSSLSLQVREARENKVKRS